VQLSPQLQAAPHVHVPLALAGQGPDELPHVFPGQPSQVQLGPQEQTSPQVQVPLALAGHEAPSAALPQVPGQPAQRQVSPHWQLSPQVPVEYMF